jgi:hypothetical protein
MRALVDADILCYEYGNFKDTDSGQLMAWEIVRGLVDGRIAAILEAVGATSQSFYLTDSVSNFRMEVATIVPYKGKRPKAKPPHWALIREHLIDNYDAEVCYGIEADDKVGIEQSINFNSVVKAAAEDDNLGCYWKGVERYCDTIICSRDKDLHMIAGWHYSWQCGKQKERKWYVDEEDGLRFFYKQLITGDSTDNILGLFGVGEKSTLVSALDDMTDEPDMYAHVHSKYEDRFGSYSFQFMLENARLLWICRGIFGETPADEALCYMEIMKSKYDRRTHDGEENS